MSQCNMGTGKLNSHCCNTPAIGCIQSARSLEQREEAVDVAVRPLLLLLLLLLLPLHQLLLLLLLLLLLPLPLLPKRAPLAPVATPPAHPRPLPCTAQCSRCATPPGGDAPGALMRSAGAGAGTGGTTPGAAPGTQLRAHGGRLGVGRWGDDAARARDVAI
jgi:hypothetical protein